VTQNVSLIVFDFDGVMTDNRVYVFEDGREAVVCNRSDGLGVTMLKAAGFDMLILSTETNPVVARRAEKLKLPYLHGIGDKGSALMKIAADRGIAATDIAMVGNDVNDMPAMDIAGLSIAPADAHRDILAIADHVTKAKGGHGVVRELAEYFSTDIQET
jgi:3-deoxy-D-manno-octulosonate 8-phosphate phosphatase (KDO 8-P phosphatase)